MPTDSQWIVDQYVNFMMLANIKIIPNMIMMAINFFNMKARTKLKYMKGKEIHLRKKFTGQVLNNLG